MKQNEETRNMQEKEKELVYDRSVLDNDDDEGFLRAQEDELSPIEPYEGFWAEEDIDIEEERRLFLEHYMSQIHGVDVGLQEDFPISRDMLRDLVEDVGTALADPDIVINPFLNQRDRQAHLLVVSRRPLLDVIRALPADAAYSVVPAFLTDKEHLAWSVYTFMSLNRCYAATLMTY